MRAPTTRAQCATLLLLCAAAQAAAAVSSESASGAPRPAWVNSSAGVHRFLTFDSKIPPQQRGPIARQYDYVWGAEVRRRRGDGGQRGSGITLTRAALGRTGRMRRCTVRPTAPTPRSWSPGTCPSCAVPPTSTGTRRTIQVRLAASTNVSSLGSGGLRLRCRVGGLQVRQDDRCLLLQRLGGAAGLYQPRRHRVRGISPHSTRWLFPALTSGCVCFLPLQLPGGDVREAQRCPRVRVSIACCSDAVGAISGATGVGSSAVCTSTAYPSSFRAQCYRCGQSGSQQRLAALRRVAVRSTQSQVLNRRVTR